jgi:hypothetical protein
MLTIIGYIAVSMFSGGGRNVAFILPMGLSVLASVAFSIYSYRKEKQKQAELEKGYEERLTELYKDMRNYHDMQRRFYRYNYPDRLTTFRIVHNARREVEKEERTLRAEARLWERRVTDDDFGVIRLGMGTLPSTVTYVLGKVENFEDPQVREAMKLVEDSRFVPDIPVIVSCALRARTKKKRNRGQRCREQEEKVPGNLTRPPTPWACRDRQSVYEFVRSMLGHFRFSRRWTPGCTFWPPAKSGPDRSPPQPGRRFCRTLLWKARADEGEKGL